MNETTPERGTTDETVKFVLRYEPLRSRLGRKRDKLIRESGDEMVRLLDGKEVTLTALAIVCGLDLSVISRRVDEARARMGNSIAAHDPISGPDLRYFEKRYANSTDPSVREFVKSLNGRRRKRA